MCLNPYCSGQWSRTYKPFISKDLWQEVLILIVVDNGLVQLVHIINSNRLQCLNPYCSGQWSRTSG